MRFSGPERYTINIDDGSFTIRSVDGADGFAAPASCAGPKLYILSVDGRPVYVGVTKQRMQARLRYGFTADGESGYHGYAWRHCLTSASLDVWCYDDPAAMDPMRDAETVEAEVVFLIRQSGQWPEHQTEIHFHASNDEHRAWAAKILAAYRLGGAVPLDSEKPAPSFANPGYLSERQEGGQVR
jgi:hypothetical protein